MKKKIIAFAMVFAMAAVAIVGGTMAYFTDKDEATNTFTVGNVNISLIEQEHVLDENGEYAKDDEDNYIYKDFKEKELMPGSQNAVDKIVTVENTGDNPVYVRVKITVPAAIKNVIHLVQATDNQDWETLTPVEGEKDEDDRVYVACYKNILNTADEDDPTANITAAVLDKVYLDSSINYNHDTEKYYYVVNGKPEEVSLSDIHVDVVAEAIQAEGFSGYEEAFEAFDNQK